MLQEKVQNQGDFNVPGYLCDGKYQSPSRYPAPGGQGYGISDTLISEVDCLFADLVEMVPLQFNRELIRTLKQKRTHTKTGISILNYTMCKWIVCESMCSPLVLKPIKVFLGRDNPSFPDKPLIDPAINGKI